jgi:excisionase family DNA binding protein
VGRGVALVFSRLLRFQGVKAMYDKQSQEKTGSVDVIGAAEELGTSTKFIRRRIADGSLPAFRIKGSRLIRINRSDLESLKQPVGGAV